MRHSPVQSTNNYVSMRGSEIKTKACEISKEAKSFVTVSVRNDMETNESIIEDREVKKREALLNRRRE